MATIVYRLLWGRRLRTQPLRAILAILSIAAGVAIVVAVAVTTVTLDDSVREFGRSLAGAAELRVVGATDRGGLPIDVVNRVEDVAGVDAAIPMIQAVTLVDRLEPGVAAEAVDSYPTLVLGVDCRAIALVKHCHLRQ